MAVDVTDGVRIDLTGGTDQADMATDYDSGTSSHFPYAKLVWGADGTFNIVDSASGKPLPVTLYSSTGSEITNDTYAENDAFSGGSATVLSGVVRRDGIGTNVSANNDVDTLSTNGYGVQRVSSPSEHAIQIDAGSTDQVIQMSTGAAGDYLEKLVIFPATTTPGNVILEDGTATSPTFSMTVFAGGTDSVTTLHPFTVPVGAYSQDGEWVITTGANVSVMAVGHFS